MRPFRPSETTIDNRYEVLMQTVVYKTLNLIHDDLYKNPNHCEAKNLTIIDFPIQSWTPEIEKHFIKELLTEVKKFDDPIGELKDFTAYYKKDRLNAELSLGSVRYDLAGCLICGVYWNHDFNYKQTSRGVEPLLEQALEILTSQLNTPEVKAVKREVKTIEPLLEQILETLTSQKNTPEVKTVEKELEKPGIVFFETETGSETETESEIEIEIESESEIETETSKIIIDAFNNMHYEGWKYAFKNERDYQQYTSLLADHFDKKSYSIPRKVIELKPRCKTKMANTLGAIHKSLSDAPIFKKDKDFFDIVRVLEPFKGETQGDLYKSLSRDRDL